MAFPEKITLTEDDLDKAKRLQAMLFERNFEALMKQTPKAVLADPATVLVCDSQEEETAYRALLDAKGYSHIKTRVAGPTDSRPAKTRRRRANQANKSFRS